MFIAFFVPLVTAATSDSYNKMQCMYMHSLVGIGHGFDMHILFQMKIIEGTADATDHCTWKGVTCESRSDGYRAVCRIEWQRIEPENIELRWVPHTVKDLVWETMKLRTIFLNTRCLPRDLLLCRLLSCYLYGTPDLRVLPDTLQELDLRWNQLSGTLDFLALPETIRNMRFEGNSFNKIVVSNRLLPENLEEVNFYQEKLMVERLSGKKLDQRIKIEKIF